MAFNFMMVLVSIHALSHFVVNVLMILKRVVKFVGLGTP
jgi:hypothetical protein